MEKKLIELKDNIEKINIDDYNFATDEIYNNLYNAVIDYENDTQDFDFDYLFEDYIDYDLAEERAKYELENGGLERMRYYIGDTCFYMEEIFKINGYGNLENVYRDDLSYLKDEILGMINDKIKEVE